MHVSVATMIGLLAGSMTTAAWLPQVAKAFRTKSTRDFSWGWFALFGFGVAFWIVYGLAADAVAVIVPNALTFLLILGLFLLKLAHAGADGEAGREAEAESGPELAPRSAPPAMPLPAPRPEPLPAPEPSPVLAGMAVGQA
jgi:MtN3 and saliva related transmembrane protein